MKKEDSPLPEDYKRMFELGLFEENSPACKVFADTEVCPIVLAALVTALLETVMRAVPDSQQIEFETKFKKALDIMMEERFEYDVVTKELEED